MSEFTMGSDPELLLADEKGNLKSAIGIIKATAENRIIMSNGRGQVNEFYPDNVLAECSIPPGVGKEAVLNNFRDCFRQYAEMVAPLKLIPQASADYPAKEVDTPEAKIIGCNPEFCAYDLAELPKPTDAYEGTGFRTAGGHVHLGAEEGVLRTDSGDEYGFFFVVRMLDLFLAVPSMFMDKDPTGPRRKKIYGVAGAHRWKPYGVEYRTLSNFWIASPQLVSTVHDICDFTIDFVTENRHLKYWKIDEDAIDEGEAVSDAIKCFGYDVKALRDCVNRGDTVKGAKFFDLVRDLMPASLFADITTQCKADRPNFYKAWSL